MFDLSHVPAMTENMNEFGFKKQNFHSIQGLDTNHTKYNEKQGFYFIF